MSQRRVIVAVTVVALLLFVPAIRGYEEAFTTTLMVAIAILKLVQLPPASAFPGYRHLMTLVICINLPSQLVAVYQVQVVDFRSR